MTEVLQPDHILPSRPFTHPDHSTSDLAMLNRMLGLLRQWLPSLLEQAVMGNYQYVQFEDDQHTQHKIVLPHRDQLPTAYDLTAVGFFGQAREVDHTRINEMETHLIGQMGDNLGLMVYYNVYIPSAGWGNLVLFDAPDTKDAWGYDAVHRQAVGYSPEHYHSIRLHNGRLKGALLGEGSITLTLTKYLDFTHAEKWQGIRHYA